MPFLKLLQLEIPADVVNILYFLEIFIKVTTTPPPPPKHVIN
jgi:hypothetical protein